MDMCLDERHIELAEALRDLGREVGVNEDRHDGH